MTLECAFENVRTPNPLVGIDLIVSNLKMLLVHVVH